MNSQLKPKLPRSYGWSHSLKDHAPLVIEFRDYAKVCQDFLTREGMVEHLRRQYPDKKILVGVSIGLESVYLESYPTRCMNAQSNTTPFPNPLRLAFFQVDADGPKLLSRYTAGRVLCHAPDLTSLRLLRPGEAAASRIALNNFLQQKR